MNNLKQEIMKNPFKKGSIVAMTTSKLSSYILGDMHFVLKSSADITARAEAKISNKLTGRAESSVIEDRHNRTEETQKTIIIASAMLYNELNKAFTSPDDDDSAQAAYESEVNS